MPAPSTLEPPWFPAVVRRGSSRRGTDAGRTSVRPPLGFDAGDADLYRYVRNAPTGLRDPTGLWGRRGRRCGCAPFFPPTYAPPLPVVPAAPPAPAAQAQPWAPPAATLDFVDPYIFRAAGEQEGQSVATVTARIVLGEGCKTYQVVITISSYTKKQKDLPAGVNTRTEYFLRQIYAPKPAQGFEPAETPARLDLAFQPRPQVQKTRFTKQDWRLTDDDIRDPNKRVLKGEKPSEASIALTYPLEGPGLAGKGAGKVTFVGRELLAKGEPKPLNEVLRQLEVEWSFSAKDRKGRITLSQAPKGAPRVSYETPGGIGTGR